MAIKKSYEEYLRIFEKYTTESNDNVVQLNKLRNREIVEKIIVYFSVPLLILMLFGAFSGGRGSGMATLFVFITFIVFIYLWNASNVAKLKQISILDQLFFNQFLIKKIKIFYSIDEMQNLTYKKIEHITTKSINAINPNQTIIDLAYIGFEKNVEGIIIVETNNTSLTSGSIDKKGGSVHTKILNATEAILIDNIKENSNIDNKDINYWFDLKEKGAITEEEYILKKNQLFNN